MWTVARSTSDEASSVTNLVGHRLPPQPTLVEVREATAEVETTTASVVQTFPTGTVVQVFLLAGSVPAGTWNGCGPGD